jgi:ABC-2 type transport system permease protein
MKAFITHFLFDFRSGLRDKTLLLMNYLFPLGFYIMMGLVMTKINPIFADSMVPSMAVFSILASTALALPNPIVGARESGIFRSYKINGVPVKAILSIPAVATIFHTTIVGIIILVTGPIFFDGKPPVNIAGFFLVFFAMATAGTGLGLLIGVVSKNSRVIILWSQLIFLPSMLIGGLMIPIKMLPESIHKICMLLPSTYAMNAFEELAQNTKGSFNPWWSVVILFSGAVLSFLLSIYLFRWDNNDASKNKKMMFALLALLPYIIGALLL